MELLALLVLVHVHHHASLEQQLTVTHVVLVNISLELLALLVTLLVQDAQLQDHPDVYHVPLDITWVEAHALHVAEVV